MKKSLICLPVLIIISFLISFVSADVRINEVELNPAGNDTGYEWIELYSDEEINLTGWKIMNYDDYIIELNQTFQDYLIIDLNRQWLDNTDESVRLFNGSSLIDSTSVIDDEEDNDKTWQYCDGGWVERSATPGEDNNCSVQEDENAELPISIEIDWDKDDITNGKEFEIEVKVFNLKDKEYDVKVWIEFEDNDTVISDRYGEDSEGEEIWKSGKYYIYNLFKGPGNKTKDVELRIREKYRDFKGDANLFVKIKGEIEKQENIEILEADEDEEEEEESEEPKETIKTALITGNVIKLGSSSEELETENIKTNDNIIYESKSEKIKKYAVFGFALLCVGLSVLLIFNKIK